MTADKTQWLIDGLKSKLAEAERNLAFWKNDASEAWKRCEERRIEAVAARNEVRKLKERIRELEGKKK